MLTAKQLLLKQTTEAFGGRPDMTLLFALKDITDKEASWRPDESLPTIEHLVRHLAWAKSTYCAQAFGREMIIHDNTMNADGDCADLPWEFPCGAGWGRAQAPGIAGAISLLERAQRMVVECLESCPEEKLEQPVEGRHGKSAANLFWVLLMHDVYHAGQIRSRRRIFEAQQKSAAR